MSSTPVSFQLTLQSDYVTNCSVSPLYYFKRMSRNRSLPPTADALYQIAVRSLARRARSIAEVRALLLRRKGAPADVEAAMQRLRDHGYLDDARFARSFVASRVENDLHGRLRVRRDLAARRVHPAVADEAVRRAFDALDETKLLRQHLRRKVRFTKSLDKPSSVQALYRRLLRAGFRSDTIVGELKRLLRASSKRGTDDAKRHGDVVSLRWDELLDSLAEFEELES